MFVGDQAAPLDRSLKLISPTNQDLVWVFQNVEFYRALASWKAEF